jgi:hypothetical protein
MEIISRHSYLRCQKYDTWSAENDYQVQQCCLLLESRGTERHSVGGRVDLHPSRTICRVPALEVLPHTAFVLPVLRWKRQAFQAPSGINHLFRLCILDSTI